MTQTLKRKKPLVVSPVRSGETHGLPDLVNLAKSEPKEFVPRLEKIVSERKLRLADIHLRDCEKAFREVTVDVDYHDDDGKKRSITSSAFPVLTGLLMVSEINEAYEQLATIGEELVTDIEDPKKVTVVMRILAMNPAKDKVEEAEAFPEIKATEEGYEVLSRRNGRRLSITRQMVDENDVVNIIERVNRLVEFGGTAVEELTLDAVCDRYGSAGSAAEPYVLRPRGQSPLGLYSSTANTPGTRAPSGTRIASNGLTSTANLEAARARLATFRNDDSKRISYKWADQVLLVPDALIGTASKLLNSELEPGVENEVNNWGPRGRNRPRLLSSPLLDDISASDWFLGRFKRQFRRKWKARFDYAVLAGTGTQRYLDAEIVWQGRLSWDVGVNAVDYVFVVQSQA